MKTNSIKQTFCILFFFLVTPLFAADLYVDSLATGSNNGSNWSNAYNTLENAITAAADNDTIHITSGIYKPVDTTNGFIITKAITILGGYLTGGGIRDSRANITTLSGDMNNGSSYAKILLKISNIVTIDGLTITKSADSSENDDTAAVVLGLGSQGSTISNCIIEENDHKWSSVFALKTGVSNKDIPVIVENCLIRNNGTTAGLTVGPYSSHGAILMYSTGGIYFNNCSFLNNASLNADFYHGGVDNQLKATLNSCTWSGSTSSPFTFRNINAGRATIVILNSIIAETGSLVGGRSMATDSVIFNSTIANTSANNGYYTNKMVKDTAIGNNLVLANNGGQTDSFMLNIPNANAISKGISIYRDSDNTLYYLDDLATERYITTDSSYTPSSGTVITPTKDNNDIARTLGYETFDLGASVYVAKNMTYSGSTTAHTSNDLAFGTTAPIIRIKINTLGESNPYSLTGFTTTITDPNNAVVNLQVFSTGSDANFNTTTPIGTVSEAGTVVIPAPHTLTPGANYIWIAGDVSTDPASLGSVVDAEITSFTVDNGSSLTDTPTITAPTGYLTIVLYLVDNGFEVEDYFDTNADGTGDAFEGWEIVASPTMDSLGNTWTFGDLNNPGTNSSVHYWTNFPNNADNMGQHIQFYGPSQITTAPGYFWEVTPANVPSFSIPGTISFDCIRGTSSNLDFVIEALDAGDNWVTLGAQTNWNPYINIVSRYSYYISDMSLYSKYRLRITADHDGTSRIHFNDIVIKNSGAATYTLTFVAGSNGTISGLNPQNAVGSSTPVEAIPRSGYVFGNWTDESDTEVGTDATFIITNPTADQTYTANFLSDTDGDGVADLYDSFPDNPNRYANLDAEDDLLVYYDFDDLSSATITDISSNSYDATLEGLNGSASNDFANDGAIDLSVAPQAYVIAGSEVAKIKPSGSYETITFWHHSDIDVDTNSPAEAIACFTDGTNTSRHFDKITIGGSDGVRISRWDGTDNWLAYATNISAGWNHFTFVWNGSYYDFLLNGVQQTDVTFSDSNNPPRVYSGRTVEVGRTRDLFSNDMFDEFRIFSRQLHSEEINDLISRRTLPTFTVTFDPTSDGTITAGQATQSIKQNFNATAPTVTAIFGKVFTGWNSNYTNIQTNTTITALYEDVTYTVTFDLGDYGIMKSGQLSQTITHGQNAIPPIFDTLEGYKFTGWNSNYTNIQANTAISTLYEEDTIKTTARYRLYNPNDGNHHWTTNHAEYDFLIVAGWAGEGFDHEVTLNATTIDAVASSAYFRLYNPNNGEHHWTTSFAEYEAVGAAGWKQESFISHVFTSQAGMTVPLFRLYNPNSGLHHYTTNSSEQSILITAGWADEGISAYVFPKSQVNNAEL